MLRTTITANDICRKCVNIKEDYRVSFEDDIYILALGYDPEIAAAPG